MGGAGGWPPDELPGAAIKHIDESTDRERFHVRGCGAEAAASPATTPAAAKTAVEGLERLFLLCGDAGSDTDVSAFGNQLPSLSGEFGIDGIDDALTYPRIRHVRGLDPTRVERESNVSDPE